MKTLIRLLILIILGGCGTEDKNREMCTTYGQSCHATLQPTNPVEGPQGTPGQDGLKGPKGAKGEPGVKGDKGEPGATGQDGLKGSTGDQGPQGATGLQGSQGIAGYSVVSQTEVLPVNSPECPAGGTKVHFAQDFNKDDLWGIDDLNQQTVITCNGLIGATGAIGPQGSQGPQGLPGQSVTTVEFCPSQGATVYPSHFPEYGLCIEGAIYGVYWDDHGRGSAWLAQIAPGTYVSTATGLACTFKVTTNCGITQ